MAGTGKTTISRTLAHDWADQKRLGASFFFSKGDGDLGKAAKFFTTLAKQLAITLPALKPCVSRAIAENPDISDQTLHEQWRQLIFQPLSNLKDIDASLQSRLFIIVIDALDECDDEKDIQKILLLLAESKTLNTVRLRVFATSRRETTISNGFREISNAHQDFILHDIPRTTVDNDISIFFRHELRAVGKREKLPEGWFDEDTVQRLCQSASGLFIYASTACRLIRGPPLGPEEALSMILKSDYMGLDDMYSQILKHLIAPGNMYIMLRDQVRRIVGCIAILLDPLSATMLASLLDMPARVLHTRLNSLHSVLNVPDNHDSEHPIRLLHLSFRDFLLDQKRCEDPNFWVDEKKTHRDLFASCLKLMSKHLKTDVCNLRLPGTLAAQVRIDVVKSHLPPDLQYACRYWVNHLHLGNIELSDYEVVYTFLKEHLLHWLEALCLMGKVADGIYALKTLESMLTVSTFMVRRSGLMD